MESTPTVGKEKNNTIDFEIDFYEGILARHPDYVAVLKVIGNLYTTRGFFEKGLAVDLRLSVLCPKDLLVYYNLACSCALTARVDDAFKALDRAFDLGYRDWLHMEKDRDLDMVRNDPRYVEMIRRMQGGNA